MSSVTPSSHVVTKEHGSPLTEVFSMRGLIVIVTAIVAVFAASPAGAQAPASQPHNVVLFVADGLRSRMVDDATAPTMAAIAREGVSLRNSHSLFPTFTTANASAMATGHMLGDTGDFSNTIYTGFEVRADGGVSQTPFLESDSVLGQLDEKLRKLSRRAHDPESSPAARATVRRPIGKIGPTLIFDHTNATASADDHRRRLDGRPTERHPAVGGDDRAA